MSRRSRIVGSCLPDSSAIRALKSSLLCLGAMGGLLLAGESVLRAPQAKHGGLGWLAATLLAADDDSSAAGWILTPPVLGRVDERDGAARVAMLDLIDSRQTKEFREAYQVDVPLRPTGLPGDYDVMLFAGGAAGRAHQIEVRVRNGRATVELALPPVVLKRGEVSHETIDSLVRQFIYGVMASYRQRPQDDDDDSIRGGIVGRGASHTSHVRIEIQSRTAGRPFALKSDVLPPLYTNVERDHRGVAAFAHTELHNRLADIAFKQLPDVPFNDATGREMVERLRQIPTPKKPSGGEEPGSKEGKAGGRSYPTWEEQVRRELIEPLVLARLAVACQAKEAMPHLRRLGLRAEERLLAVYTADDQRQAIREAFELNDWPLSHDVVNFVGKAPTPARVDALLDHVAIAEESFGAIVCKILDHMPLDPKQIERLRSLRESTSRPWTKVAITRTLLWQLDDDASFCELIALASKPMPKESKSLYSHEQQAFEAVVMYANETGKRRSETADMMRTLLDRVVPESATNYERLDYLLRYLGKIGDKSDIARLKRFALPDRGHESMLAIESIVVLDAEQGLSLAREKMRGFLAGREQAEFHVCVYYYLDLLLNHRDEAAAPLLDAAIAKEVARNPAFVTNRQYELANIVLQYLRASTAQQRATLAVTYYREQYHSATASTRRLAERLIAEGADPAQLAPLIPSIKGKR